MLLTGSGPNHLAADSVVRDQHDQDHQEHGEIKAADSLGQTMGNEDQGRLEMDEDEIEEDQPEIGDLFFQLNHPSISPEGRRLAISSRGIRFNKHRLRQDQQNQEKERLSQRIEKKGRRPRLPKRLPAPQARPAQHFLGKPGIGVNGHDPRDYQKKPGGKGQ